MSFKLNDGWIVTIQRIADEGEIFSMTSTGSELGKVLGDILHAAIRDEGEGGNSPMYHLMNLVWALNSNYISFQDDILARLEQVLAKFQASDNGELSDLAQIMRKEAEWAQKRANKELGASAKKSPDAS